MVREVLLPRSLDQLWDIWAQQPQARVYCGGTDLLVHMRQNRCQPPALICLERIPELRELSLRDDHLYIGAGNTHADLLANPMVQEKIPVLAKALQVLGSPPIRHAGTIGGNICTASPAGDTLPPLYCLHADLELRTAQASRWVSVADFIRGPGHTSILPHELLVAVRVPLTPSYNVHHFEKVGRREALACAVVSLAALLEVTGDKIIHRARLAWGSVGPTVVTIPEVETALTGQSLSLETLSRIQTLIPSAVSPIDDVRASANYRRMVAGNLVLRLWACGPPSR